MAVGRKPLRRGAVVLALAMAAVAFIWQERHSPVESPLILVLTDLEVAAEGTLLRYEAAKTLQVLLRDENGAVVATVRARGGAAVVPAATVTLPKGTYMAELSATLLAPSGAEVKRTVNRRVAIDGTSLELRY